MLPRRSEIHLLLYSLAPLHSLRENPYSTLRLLGPTRSFFFSHFPSLLPSACAFCHLSLASCTLSRVVFLASQKNPTVQLFFLKCFSESDGIGSPARLALIFQSCRAPTDWARRLQQPSHARTPASSGIRSTFDPRTPTAFNSDAFEALALAPTRRCSAATANASTQTDSRHTHTHDA